MNFRKLLFVIGALGMLLASCAKVSEIENLDESTGLPREITATFNATRTSVDDSWNTTWDDNDKMTVYVTRESSRSYKYGYSQFTYKGGGKFDGDVNSDFCEPYNWFAVYPSFHSSSSTSKTVTAEIEHPASQTMIGGTKAHIAGANDPLFGYALGVQTNPTITMHHIASVIDFNITNGSENAIKVTKVEFTAPVKIAGEFTADVNLWDGEVENPEWTAGSSAFNTVTLNVSDGVEIAKGGNSDFYAAIHPISANGSYTIKVTATSGGKTYVAEKTVNANFTFKAGKYKTVNFTFNATEPVQEKYYVKVTSAPQDWSGTYLIVRESSTSSNYVFAYDKDNYKTTVNISSSTIVSGDLAKYEVTISKSSDGNSDHYVVKTSDGRYLYYTGSSNPFLNNTESNYYAKLDGTNGNFTLNTKKSSNPQNKAYFRYSSPAFGFNTNSGTIQLYELEGDTPTPPTPPTPSTEKTYTKVTSLSNLTEGTYLICGYETAGTYVCLFPPVTATYTDQSKKFDTSNKFEHNLFSTDNGITTITTSDASIIGSEVKITKSGDNYLIQYNGQYMYYNNGTIDFTSTSSSATQTIGSFSNGKTSMTQGNQLFYHSGTNEGFGYKNRTGVSNIMFFKLEGEPDTPDTPTPSGAVFNLENDYLKAYLDAAEKQYTNNTTSSIVAQYIGSSSGGSGWYGGGGVANDLPKPVTLTWTGSATSISIYEGSNATGTAVKTMSFSSSSSVDIYNLIPGKTYSYKTSNNQTGTFSTTGRRRMIKVSDTKSENHARNCRDLGGIQTRDGKTLKYGLIYRGTNVDDVSDSEKGILHDELGIRLDQDLRNETKKTSSPIGSDVEFCHHGGYDANTITSQDGDNMKQSVLHVMNAVIEGRPVYFHCRIGSDRTGHMGMLYLALLGCDLKECDIDYEITSFASAMTYGTRTIGSGNEESFRSKFIKSPYNNNSVPEAVEAYVTGTLNIPLDTVKKFRKAMGVSETL